MQLAQNWRLNGVRYGLKAKHCIHCGAVVSLSRQICAECQPETVEHYTFNTTNVRSAGFPQLGPVYDELRQAAR